MIRTDFSRRSPNETAGQSLVETALFLPILLFLLAATLEVSNMLITQNRVQTAARIGTGFGATNYNSDTVDDTFDAMTNVTLNNVKETVQLEPERWDIYTLKATVNAAGDGFTADPSSPLHPWDAWEHTYGDEDVFSLQDWDDSEQQIEEDILEALGPSDRGMEIIATITYHNRESFLGLNYFNPGLTRIRGLTVMRISETRGTYNLGGCDTFPIGLSLENYAVWPSNQPTVPPGHERYPFVPNLPPGTYTGNSYWWPNHDDGPPPYYTVEDTSNFPANTPGTYITTAQPGDLFLVKQADAELSNIAGAFGWLRWDMDPSSGNEGTLAGSLEWPGNSTTYRYPPWSLDGVINKYDLVKVSTGTKNSIDVRTWMSEHVEEGLLGRQLRIIVFTPPDYMGGDANSDGHGTGVNTSGGNSVDFEVYAFVRVRIVGWKLTGQENWLLVEFIAWDEECVVSPATP